MLTMGEKIVRIDSHTPVNVNYEAINIRITIKVLRAVFCVMGWLVDV